jgi:hypothetical protein
VIKSLDANRVINLHSDISPLVPALDGKENFEVSERRLGEPRGATGYGDRPPTFQWQSPLSLVDALGMSAARNGASGP